MYCLPKTMCVVFVIPVCVYVLSSHSSIVNGNWIVDFLIFKLSFHYTLVLFLSTGWHILMSLPNKVVH